MQEQVVVLGLDKYNGYIKATTICDKADSQRYAKYYRSIGYGSKVVTFDELDKIIECEREERNMAI